MENYVSYRSFESIDAYYNSRTKVEDYYEKLQDFPSKNEVAHKEYIVHQLTEAFLYYSNLAISARRANNEAEIQINYNYAMDSYNYLTSQILELNNLRLQQNGQNLYGQPPYGQNGQNPYGQDQFPQGQDPQDPRYRG